MSTIRPHSEVRPPNDQPTMDPPCPQQMSTDAPLANDDDVAEVPLTQFYPAARHLDEEISLIRVLERVLHSWPVTLRVALLLVILVTGIVAVVSTMDVVGELLLAGWGYHVISPTRREN